MERKWILKNSADPEKVSRLGTELGIDRVLAELLVQRGVETFEEARKFFQRDTMEQIVKSVNRKEEGGDGLADDYVMKYSEVQHG